MAHDDEEGEEAPQDVQRSQPNRAQRRAAAPRPRKPRAWYAASPQFQQALGVGLDEVAEHRGRVTTDLRRQDEPPHYRVLVYRHAGLDVPGRRHAVHVEVQFHEDPSFTTYGLEPADYPRVTADPGASSKHRNPDGSLCLYFPRDPEERRWRHTTGLAVLFEIVRKHLVLEDRWRATGGAGDERGRGEGVWLGDEAPHGFPARAESAA